MTAPRWPPWPATTRTPAPATPPTPASRSCVSTTRPPGSWRPTPRWPRRPRPRRRCSGRCSPGRRCRAGCGRCPRRSSPAPPGRPAPPRSWWWAPPVTRPPPRAGPGRWPASSSGASSCCARAPTTSPTTTRPACAASSTLTFSTAAPRPRAPSAPAESPARSSLAMYRKALRADDVSIRQSWRFFTLKYTIALMAGNFVFRASAASRSHSAFSPGLRSCTPNSPIMSGLPRPGGPVVEGLEHPLERAPLVAPPARIPVVAVGADPVDVGVAGIELLRLAGGEAPGVGAPDPRDVLDAGPVEDAVDALPGGDELGRRAGDVLVAGAVHLPEPLEEDGGAERFHVGGPLLDQPVVTAGVDGRGRRLGPRHERDAAVFDVPLLPPAGEGILPAACRRGRCPSCGPAAIRRRGCAAAWRGSDPLCSS